MNTISKPKDKEYFKKLSEANPQLKEFITEIAKRYSRSLDGRIACDSLGKLETFCNRRLYPEEVKLFVTPGPAYTPMILCPDCLRREYAKVAATGEYDVHERYLDKDHPARNES